jgi:hypothetical protein
VEGCPFEQLSLGIVCSVIDVCPGLRQTQAFLDQSHLFDQPEFDAVELDSEWRSLIGGLTGATPDLGGRQASVSNSVHQVVLLFGESGELALGSRRRPVRRVQVTDSESFRLSVKFVGPAADCRGVKVQERDDGHE